MKKEKLIIGIILTTVILSAIIISVILIRSSEGSVTYEPYNMSHGRRTGNNDIDRLIKKIYEKDSFLNEDEIETPYVTYKNKKPQRNTTDTEYYISTLEYNNNVYYSRNEYVEEIYIGDKIDTVEKIYDERGKVEIELCSIKGISPKVAIGVSEVGGEIKGLFFTEDYEVNSITELIEECGLKEGAILAYSCLLDYKNTYSITYTGITLEKVMEGLFGDIDSMVIKEYDSSVEKTGLSFRIYIESINEFFEFIVLENGDLMIKCDLLVSQTFLNENGLEKGIDLINYMRSNFDGMLREWGRE